MKTKLAFAANERKEEHDQQKVDRFGNGGNGFNIGRPEGLYWGQINLENVYVQWKLSWILGIEVFQNSKPFLVMVL